MASSYDNDSLCRKVAEIFDVTVDEDDIKLYPFFAAVLSNLCSYASSGDVKNSELEAEQAKQACAIKQALFFQQSIFTSAIFEVVDSNKENKFSQYKVSCLCNGKYGETVVSAAEYLSMGLTNNILPSEGDTNGLRNLALTKEFFMHHFQPLNGDFISTALIPGVTHVMQEFSRSVLAYHGQESNEKLVFAKISQLPNLLAKETSDLETNHMMVKKDKKLLNEQIKKYFECLATAILLLEEKAELTQTDKEACSLSTNFFAIKCDALYLKTKILHMQIMNDTYNTETIYPLNIIRQQLLEKEGNLEQELMEKTTKLKNYETIGKSFQCLVNEFSELSSQIKNAKWALAELKKEGN